MTDFQPAQPIVDALKASPLPREAKAAMVAFSSELGSDWRYSWSPFRCLFGFQEWTGSLGAFPPWPGATVGGLTTHAAGAWQDEPATYAEITALTGNPGFEPQDQIANNWVLAVRDFGARSSGADLLAALKAGQYVAVSAALRTTWPAGADGEFGDRYTAALPLFEAAPPPSPPPPAPPPPAPPPGNAITLRVGLQESFPIAGTDQDGQPYTPPDALVCDDPQICTVSVAPAPNPITGIATIAAVGLGRTLVHGADLAIAVTVEAPRLVHLTADLSKAVVSRIPVSLAAMVIMLGLFATPAEPPSSPFPPAIEAPSSVPIEPTRQIDREQKLIGDPDFCAASGSAVAIARCLKWTAALSRR
jgi:hypothetical protein